jgi:hypothetical protein
MKILFSWSVSLLPWKMGRSFMNSPKMHPMDHTSTAVE